VESDAEAVGRVIGTLVGLFCWWLLGSGTCLVILAICAVRCDLFLSRIARRMDPPQPKPKYKPQLPQGWTPPGAPAQR
jgi:hypothetical protein